MVAFGRISDADWNGVVTRMDALHWRLNQSVAPAAAWAQGGPGDVSYSVYLID